MWGQATGGGARPPKRLNRSPPCLAVTQSPPRQALDAETFSWAPGTMLPLKTLLLAALLLGASLQSARAGESRAQVTWGGAGGRDTRTDSCIIYTPLMPTRDWGGWQQGHFEESNQRKIMMVTMMLVLPLPRLSCSDHEAKTLAVGHSGERSSSELPVRICFISGIMCREGNSIETGQWVPRT